MSSRVKKLRPSGQAPAERCTFCGRKAGARGLRMRGGQLACPRCLEHGELQRLDCGHLATPGSYIIRNVAGHGESRCLVCAGDMRRFR